MADRREKKNYQKYTTKEDCITKNSLPLKVWTLRNIIMNLSDIIYITFYVPKIILDV